MHSSIDMIVDGIVEGKQGQKLETVVPQTDLNMVCPLLLKCVPEVIHFKAASFYCACFDNVFRSLSCA